MEEEGVKGNNVAESPYVHYVPNIASKGMPLPEQKFMNYTIMGIPKNKDFIRNSYTWNKEEADLFTWGMTTTDEMTRGNIIENFTPVMQGV